MPFPTLAGSLNFAMAVGLGNVIESRAKMTRRSSLCTRLETAGVSGKSDLKLGFRAMFSVFSFIRRFNIFVWYGRAFLKLYLHSKRMKLSQVSDFGEQ